VVGLKLGVFVCEIVGREVGRGLLGSTQVFASVFVGCLHILEDEL